MSEDGIGQRFRSFGRNGLENRDFGGFIGEGDHEFVVAVGSERTVYVQMHSGVGDLRRFLGMLKHLAVVAGFCV